MGTRDAPSRGITSLLLLLPRPRALRLAGVPGDDAPRQRLGTAAATMVIIVARMGWLLLRDGRSAVDRPRRAAPEGCTRDNALGPRLGSGATMVIVR